MTKKERMNEAIKEHGKKLNAIFNTQFDDVQLSKKLHRLEIKAHRATTNLLNTNTLHLSELNRYTGYDVKQSIEDEIDTFFDAILRSVYKALGEKAKDLVFINFDARGYALKIRDTKMKELKINIYSDFGGYGILAPDFSNL